MKEDEMRLQIEFRKKNAGVMDRQGKSNVSGKKEMAESGLDQQNVQIELKLQDSSEQNKYFFPFSEMSVGSASARSVQTRYEKQL